MGKRELRRELLSRMSFIGCQFCGAVDRPLRNYGTGKICPECLRQKQTASKLDTGKDEIHD